MKTNQYRKLEMLRRVQHYLDEFAAKLTVVNATGARQELDAIVQEMAENVSKEATSVLNAKSQTARLEVQRRELWNHHMLPVATIAAAHLRQVPEFKALKMPVNRMKSVVLVPAALAMAEAARQYSEVFLQNGRSADFADALVAAATALGVTAGARGDSIGTKASARNGLKVAGQRAKVLVRLLDVQVKELLVDDPNAVAKWNSVKKIGKAKATPVEVATPAAATQATEAKAA